MSRIELHCHSTASDGSLSPTKLVELAKSREVTHLALTDHDTTDGVKEAQQAAGDALEIIPGIELSCYHEKKEVHVLGYFVDPDNPPLQALLVRMQQARRRRMQKMLEQLSGAGVTIEEEQVLAHSSGPSVGRPHLAEALVVAGHVADRNQAFDLYLGYGKPAYVPRTTLTVPEALAALKEAGAATVLAHPGLLRSRAMATRLIDSCSFDGMEVWHPCHQKKDQKRFLRLARSRELIPCGGSDFHCPIHSEFPLGSMKVPAETIEALRGKRRGIAAPKSKDSMC